MRSVAARASMARCCALANSRKTPPISSAARRSAATDWKRASPRMRPPRSTSATPVASSSRVASATSSAKARPMRRPSAQRDERRRRARAPGRDPLPALGRAVSKRTTACPSVERHRQPRLALVVAGDREERARSRDVDVEAVRRAASMAALRPRASPSDRVEDALRQLGGVVLARRRVERAQVRVHEQRRPERHERHRRHDGQQQPLAQPRRPPRRACRGARPPRATPRPARAPSSRATDARMVTYAGSAATLAIVMRQEHELAAAWRDRSSRAGAGRASVADADRSVPGRSSADQARRRRVEGDHLRRVDARGAHRERLEERAHAAARRAASRRRRPRWSPASPTAPAPCSPRPPLGSSSSRRGAKATTSSPVVAHATSWMARSRATSWRAARFTPSPPSAARGRRRRPRPARSTLKVEPRPTSLSTLDLAAVHQDEAPRDGEAEARCRAAGRAPPCVCLYSSKMTARSCGLMPGPVSRTLTRAKRPSRPTSTTTSPRCVNLMALPTRFVSTCRTRRWIGAREDARLALDAHRRPGARRRAPPPRARPPRPPPRGRRASATSLSCPLSSALNSRMSLMRSSRCLPEPRICSTSSRASGESGPVDLGHEDVGEAEDGVERAAQLVADGGEEGRAIAVGRAHALEVALVARLRGGEAADERVERDGERRRPRPSCAPARPRRSARSARAPCRARARRRSRRPCSRRATRRRRRPPRRRRGASSARRARAAGPGAPSGALGSRTKATSTRLDGRRVERLASRSARAPGR